MLVRSLLARPALVVLVSVVLSCAISTPGSATPTYDLSLWSSLRGDGQGGSYAFAINDSGSVAGGADASDGAPHVVVRTRDGVLHDGGSLVAGLTSHGSAINSAGEVAGYGSTASNGFAAPLRWHAGAPGIIGLGRLPGGGDALVFSMSDSGVAVGWSNRSSGCGSPECTSNPGFAVKWTGDTGPTPLPALGGYYSSASGISRDGSRICGYGANGAGQTRAFRLDGDTVVELPPLPGYDACYAWGVNDAGHVVGHSEITATQERRATLWIGSLPIDLGTLPGTTGSEAYRITDTGLIVGGLQVGADYVAASFSPNAAPVDLNTRLTQPSDYVLRWAYGVNNVGQVCGYADSAGVVHGFLLTPAAGVDVSLASVPARLALECASRNPGAGATTLTFTLPAPERARLEILDVTGRRVARLVDDALDAGPHEARWDARGADGGALAPGVYLARLVAGSASVTRKLVLAR